MAPVEGNAWAQSKARERERQLADPNRVPTPKPVLPRNFSGLDYDAELALPMPKPRHVRPEDTESKPDPSTKPNVTKKRSTTEPSLPSGRQSKSEASEKKKSKVASLRSKFSLKDIGKEFRKEIPPLSSMPKLGGRSVNEIKRASSDAESQSPQTFNEAKLYVPKTRTGDIVPNSAPPHTTEFRESSSSEKAFEDSFLSCPFLSTPTKNGHGGNTLLNSSSPARNGGCNNTVQPEPSPDDSRMVSIKAGSNLNAANAIPQTPPPPAPPSLEAVTYSPSVYDTPKKVTSKASESSLYQKKESQQMKHPLIVSSSSYKGTDREEPIDDQMFMDPRTPPPPPALPTRSRARDAPREQQNHLPYDEAHFLAGVTSHGGYAPPPPHPGYQNTVTLEQQLVAHTDSLHYHFHTAVDKMTRNIENNNNWTADQILRQVESMSDLTRLINTRTAAQADFIKEIPGLLMDARMQINAAQHEIRQTEERLKSFIQSEVARMKTELSELLVASVSGALNPQAHDWRTPGTYMPHQGQGSFRPSRDGDKRTAYQNKRKSNKQLPPKPHENVFNKAETKKSLVDQSQDTKPAPITQSDHAKHNGEHQTVDTVPTPTAAFPTPAHPSNDPVTPVQAKRPVTEYPGEESSGSPKSKAAKLRISSPQPISDPQSVLEGMQKTSLENSRTQTSLYRESDSKPQSQSQSHSEISNCNEAQKTPTSKKKGAGTLFSFRRKGDNGDTQSGNRFLRTPRRTKEGKASGQEGQSPRLAISSPIRGPGQSGLLASPSLSSLISPGVSLNGAQIPRCESPSSIHPALRTPQQRQMMLDRERRLAALNRHIQGHAHGQAHGQNPIYPLRTSHSHQNFHTKSTSPLLSHPSFISYDAPNPRYASGLSMATSSSLSSFHGVNHYQPPMHYHQPSSSSLPPPPQAPGQDQDPAAPQPLYHAPQPMHPYPPLPDPGFSGVHGHGHGPTNAPGQFDGGEWVGNGTEHEPSYPGNNFF
ncbi:hypothetical protein BJY04DRAFT_216295 [Aspergillus karnatakaensis]|uniref:uncharacterized protein n=1 Tax=Aspergillus karnatakaensis TaxID=1810916 RepID=UPI003CCCAA6C